MTRLVFGLLASATLVLLLAAFTGERIAAGVLGPGSPAFRFPVANELRLMQEDGRAIVVGETGPTAEYQLQSEPIAVGVGTKTIQVRLSGRIESGGLYYAVLSERGPFLGPVRLCYPGPINEEGPLVPPGGNRSVRLVLGNFGQGIRSHWRIERAELLQSTRLNIDQFGFSQSAWRWAFDVLRGAWRPSKRTSGR